MHRQNGGVSAPLTNGAYNCVLSYLCPAKCLKSQKISESKCIINILSLVIIVHGSEVMVTSGLWQEKYNREVLLITNFKKKF